MPPLRGASGEGWPMERRGGAGSAKNTVRVPAGDLNGERPGGVPLRYRTARTVLYTTPLIRKYGAAASVERERYFFKQVTGIRTLYI